MSDGAQPRVGFFRGLMAVVRATTHVFAKVLGLFSRGLAAVTRRTRGKPTHGESET
ncbi:MAG: hypothetical protein Q7V88_11245 [Actinomycetota bacterium]|nr:hypothetical protein [Actinomycetota bacterium]